MPLKTPRSRTCTRGLASMVGNTLSCVLACGPHMICPDIPSNQRDIPSNQRKLSLIGVGDPPTAELFQACFRPSVGSALRWVPSTMDWVVAHLQPPRAAFQGPCL